MNDSIMKLKKEINECQKCDLYKGRNIAIDGDGVINSSIMLIGEAPGARITSYNVCYTKLLRFRKLNENTIGLSNITSMNVAGWIKDETLIFSNSTGRQSMIAKKGVEISARSVDSILNGKKATFIKYDVEGAENEAIRGSINTIESFKPKIKVALYHRNEDIFSLPLLVNEINSDYKLYIRKFPYIPAWEVNMFCI